MKQTRGPARASGPELPAATRTVIAGAVAPFGPRPARTWALPMLQAVQEAAGWLSPAVLAEVSRLSGLPVADLTGLASFYELLATAPQGQVVVRVCDDIVCSRAGRAAGILEACARYFGVRPGQTTADGRFTLHTANCLGGCDRAPGALVGPDFVGRITPADVPDLLVTPAGSASRHSWLPGHAPVLLARCGRADALGAGPDGWQALRRALGLTPEAVIATVTASGLVGRGGAAFPTGAKWDGARQAAGHPKYVVLNGDESEPGSFTNRKLLEEDPCLPLEGMIIAAYAVGAHHGYAYIRGEYDLAARRFAAAVAAARDQGVLGADVLGSGWAFDVEVRRGAGAYVCGEETALFASIAGERGEPRMKPPFPTSQGLFGRPTVINNVETLACVPDILTRGAEAFAAAPPKLFAVSGDVALPGVYEVPLGTSLRLLIDDGCGGFVGTPQAVLVGGAAGTWLTPAELDVELHPASLWSVDASLGSGAIMVFNMDVDLWQVAERLARFFASESCGKCVPCRLGTVRQWELVRQLRQGGASGAAGVAAGAEAGAAGAAAAAAAAAVSGAAGWRERLDDLAAGMADASICGLGQSASWAIQSLLRKFGPPGGAPA